MALMTMIARVADGLPLVGTMQEDEQVKIFFWFIDLRLPIAQRCEVNIFKRFNWVSDWQKRA